jgi:CelD/BcsL family acetyltransferase involved in cellulose biosynthesis
MRIHSLPGRFRTRILSTFDELVSIAADWTQLHERCSDSTPFQCPEWLLSWIEVFLPNQLRVVEVREGDRLAGLAPLLIYPRDSERVLAFAGGGVSDYLTLLLQPGNETEVFHEICCALEEDRGWSLLELTDVSRNSGLHTIRELRAYTEEHDSCSVTVLPPTGEELLRLFSERQRANLRNARSRLERAGGGEFEVATPETLPDFLAELFELHTLRWSAVNRPGVVQDKCVQGFHILSSGRLLASGRLRLYRLRVQGRTAAIIYSLFQGDTVYCYLQGFDPGFSFISPGTLLIFFLMQDAVRLGMRRFDFLRGREPYKQHWRPQVEHTFRISVPHPEIAKLVTDQARAR